MYFSQQSSLLHMFYFSLRSFFIRNFYLQRKSRNCILFILLHFIHCIQLFLHFNFPFISPLSKYLFPPSFHKFISIFPSSSLYALSSTVYHNVHTQLFPKRYYTSIFEPIFILSSPNIFQ